MFGVVFAFKRFRTKMLILGYLYNIDIVYVIHITGFINKNLFVRFCYQGRFVRKHAFGAYLADKIEYSNSIFCSVKHHVNIEADKNFITKCITFENVQKRILRRGDLSL